MPQRAEDGEDGGGAALQRAWRANPEQRAHHQPHIERARMHEQPLQHIRVSAYVRTAERAGLVEMRARPFEQFAASTKQSLPTHPPDADARNRDE